MGFIAVKNDTGSISTDDFPEKGNILPSMKIIDDPISDQQLDSQLFKVIDLSPGCGIFSIDSVASRCIRKNQYPDPETVQRDEKLEIFCQGQIFIKVTGV